MKLSKRFTDALVYATDLHGDQLRKGVEIPYASHLLAVASLVLEAGGDETCAIAGLLHDALEDQGRDGKTEAEIRERFGEEVLAIVKGCTDTEVVPKPPWRARKEAYIAHVEHASERVRLVSSADKLHNARAIVMDLRRHGPALWDRFTGGRESVWYYESLVAAFQRAGGGPLVDELARTVDAMRSLAGR